MGGTLRQGSRTPTLEPSPHPEVVSKDVQKCPMQLGNHFSFLFFPHSDTSGAVLQKSDQSGTNL